MDDLLNISSVHIALVLKLLLRDKTTLKNIIWGTSSYEDLGPEYGERCQITIDQVKGFFSTDIRPRATKNADAQAERTKKKAEVFTPSWICNKMNNYCDEEWFGRKDVFNIEDGQTWTPTEGKIEFPEGKTWKDYVDSRRLEITCGEAPYIVSRYDTSTGEIIPLRRRIGMLDRKLRVVNENAPNQFEWFRWVTRAYQSVYGYEFQGDNLLIARINLINTFMDYIHGRWYRSPAGTELKTIANIIAWNFWQMDGLTNTVPFSEIPQPKEEKEQLTMFDDEEPEEAPAVACRIFDWRSRRPIFFTDIKQEGEKK